MLCDTLSLLIFFPILLLLLKFTICVFHLFLRVIFDVFHHQQKPVVFEETDKSDKDYKPWRSNAEKNRKAKRAVKEVGKIYYVLWTQTYLFICFVCCLKSQGLQKWPCMLMHGHFQFEMNIVQKITYSLNTHFSHSYFWCNIYTNIIHCIKK